MWVSPAPPKGMGECDAQPIVGECWCGSGGRLPPPPSVASGRKKSGALLGGVASVCAVKDTCQRRGNERWWCGRGNVGGGMRVSPALATGVGEGDMQPHVGERW